MELENYDLLRGGNNTFRVTFDWFTLRPHFIILPKNPKFIIRPDFSCLNDGQTYSLINAAQCVLSLFNIPNAILSIHRGTWKSEKTQKFHAHICVDSKTYLTIFSDTLEKELCDNQLATQIKERIKSPWSKKVSITKVVEVFKKRVRDYQGQNYFAEDLDAIRRLEATERSCNAASSGPRRVPISAEEVTATDVPGEAEIWSNVTSGGPSRVSESLRHVYDTEHPKISFAGEKNDSVEGLKNVLTAMEQFATEYGLTDDTQDGCHLCLYLGSDYTKNGENVLGYIVTSGPGFYKLCPEDLRKNWSKAFKRSSGFKCLT